MEHSSLSAMHKEKGSIIGMEEILNGLFTEQDADRQQKTAVSAQETAVLMKTGGNV